MPPPPLPQPSARLQPRRSRPTTARPSSASAARAREPLFLPSSQPSEAEAELQLPPRGDEEPLFLPGTQLSQALLESGLGLEGMTAREFAAMLEGDAEEVDFEVEFAEGRQEAGGGDPDGDDDVEMGMAPTQQRPPRGGAKREIVLGSGASGGSGSPTGAKGTPSPSSAASGGSGAPRPVP